MAIVHFSDKETEIFYLTGKAPAKAGWKSVSSVALRKLDMLHYAHELKDLKSPPGNRLEELKGNMKGLYSIRINDQWRIVFKWTDLGPTQVRIMDYH